MQNAEFRSRVIREIRGGKNFLGTLHHWEQGSRTPSGAAQVLLRVAARHPEAVLDAAA